MSIPTDKLTQHLTDAKQTLDLLPGHIDREPAMQLTQLMQSGDNIVKPFQQLADEQPEPSTRVLLSSVSSLENLHVVQSITAELKRRAEAN